MLKRNGSVLGFVLAALCAAGAARGDYGWVAGATDWQAASSYTNAAGAAGVPPAGATIWFTAPAQLTVDDDSIALVSSFGRLAPLNDDWQLTVDVSTNSQLGCFIYYENKADRIRGKLVKKGAGELCLANVGDGTFHCEYSVDMELQEGRLVCPTNIAAYNHLYVGTAHVGPNAILVLPSPGNFRPSHLTGSGLVTNLPGRGYTQLQPQGNGTEPDVFSGVLAGNFLFFGRSHQYLTGVDNTMESTSGSSGSARVYGANDAGTRGILGVRKIGKIGEPSSIGTYKTFIFQGDDPGCLLYLGEGETSNKHFSFPTVASVARAHVFDAGATGGLTLTGEFLHEHALMTRLVLTGSNTLPCTVKGKIGQKTAGGTNYTFYVTKRGSGTWRFDPPLATSYMRGPYAVEAGTLEFGTIAEKGATSSLGYSDELWPDEATAVLATPVTYAFLLGGAQTIGTMASFSNVAQRATTRPFALTGKGGRVLANGGALKLGGFSSYDAAGSTLRLGGTNGAAENVAWNVTDGNGPLSVVKEGANTWTLDGEQSFSGGLTVEEGTLFVRNASNQPFDHFRFTVKETASSCARYSPGEISTRIQLYNIVLQDASGRRQLVDATLCSNYYGLAEGQVAYGVEKLPTAGGTPPQHVDLAFVNGLNRYMSIVAAKTPTLADPSTWMPFVMRLTNGAPEVVSFNYQIYWGTTGEGPTYQGRTPTAYMFEGSCDGVNWTGLITNDVVEIGAGSTWVSGSEKTGVPFGTRAVNGAVNCLGNVGKVRVAAGATLKRLGAATTLDDLAVDAQGAGTIDGFAFAATGTLDVLNAAKKSRVALPGTYANCTGLANLANWTLEMNGAASTAYDVHVLDGALVLVRRGLVLTVR